MKSAGIIGTGSYLPEHILTNDFFVNYLDTTDEWIKTRTGI
jgi:3-oxoacyl-[acyl-carrier-protein] synthase-3